MKISAEALVALIVARVVDELSKRGVEIDFSGECGNGQPRADATDQGPGKSGAKKICTIDMRGYKTPLLTEGQLLTLEPDIEAIEIPAATVLTPGARDVIKSRKLTVHRNR